MNALLFATWGTVALPNYTAYQIEELARHHDEVHVISNVDRPLDDGWFKERGYYLHRYPNTGRDYQKYHDCLMELGKDWACQWDQLSLINDSILCYGPLDKFMNYVRDHRDVDVVGLNGMKFPLFHVQGSPWIAAKRFLPTMWDHFKKAGVVKPIDEIKAYELAFPELTSSMLAMYPQGKRRGWDELFITPFEDGVPLIKHYCVSPRKPFLLKQWQERIIRLAHPDTKPWQYLPVLLDPTYQYRFQV